MSVPSFPTVESVEVQGWVNAHSHLRDDGPKNYDLLQYVAPLLAQTCDAALPMPNTADPIRSGDDALRYNERIDHYAPNLTIIPTIFLRLDTTPQMIREAAKAGVQAAKMYILGTTTNSTNGVPIDRIDDFEDVFHEMAACGMVLCVHGEDPRTPYHARERAFLPTFKEMATRYAGLTIVFEHISSKEAIAVCLAHENVYMTITPHHLWLTSDDVLGDPFNMCMPVIKNEEDRAALIRLFVSGHPRVMIGYDDAPHPIASKLNIWAGKKTPAGIWNVVAAPLIYTEVLARHGATKHLQALASDNARSIYRLPPPARTLRLVRTPTSIPFERNIEAPQHFLANETLPWSIAR